MTGRSDRDGNALISVLVMLTALTPLGAFAVMQARLDVLVQHHVGRALSAFAVAEAGVEHVRAELRLDPDFDRLLNGPDGQPATSDDGEFPFRKTRALPVEPGYRYDIRIDRLSATMLDLISTATGPEQSTHVLALSVVRDSAVLPAAVTASAPRTVLDLGADFRVTGEDHAGRDAAQPGVAVSDGNTEAALRADMPTDAAQRITGAGRAPSIAAVAVLPIEDLAARFAAQRTRNVGPQLDDPIGSGIAVSIGSLDVNGTTSGDGVLVVDGNLRVSGELTFSGLVIVLGDVVFETNSVVGIQGGLLQGRGQGVLALLGAGAIEYDSQVIGKIDNDFPGLLPHRARIVAWQDRS